MTTPISILAAVGAALTIGAGVPTGAQQRPGRSPAAPVSSASAETAGGGVVTTHHRVTVGRHDLRYTARAGLLPIRHNETGEVHGHMFFVAYLLDRPRGAPPRPLTFLWNGGPGASSTLVHLSGFGPRRVARDDRGAGVGGQWKLEDNQDTWLDLTDLVFVDPVGTGFSRPTKAEYGAEFYSTLGDIASVAEFVRVYLTRFDVWDAPLFIGGESYGVWRAAGVAEALVRRGRKVAGVILISGGIPVGPVVSEEVRTALFVPTRTAAAFFHKKLPSDLQTDLADTLRKAERWARTEYAPALARRPGLSASERQKVIAQLARFTGLDASLLDSKTLIVGRQQFAEQLLRDRKQVLARYDTRQTTGGEDGGRAGRHAVINRYLRGTLRFQTDLAYQGIEEGYWPVTRGQPLSVGARWNYNQGPLQPRGTPPNADAPPGGHQPWLRRAMMIAPSLKAFVAAGWYDSLNSCAANAYVVSRLEPALRRNITVAAYEGGHMMYESRGARQQLKRDIRKFIRDTLGSRPRSRP
jgi:carboxypeptidase C (cathepsin A)